MAITDFLFPQGNFLNIRSNAPNQRSYNIGATEDLVRNLPKKSIDSARNLPTKSIDLGRKSIEF